MSSLGCLCSSYIGGSFNFFSTARLLSHKLELQPSGHYDSLLSALVTADMIIMAFYFGFMDLAASSKFIQTAYTNGDMRKKFLLPNGITGSVQRNESAHHGAFDNPSNISTNHENDPAVQKRPVSAFLLSASLAYFIVRASSSFETITHIPGISSLAIALLGSSASQYIATLHHVTTNTSKVWLRKIHPCIISVGNVSGIMADLTFHLFFASVGASANLREALFKGPSAFLFTLTVVSIHIIVTIIGSLCINKFTRPMTMRHTSPWINKIFDFLPLSFEEVMVGSNAAIGGPSTAASLSSRMNLNGLYVKDELYSNKIRKSLILSGLLCGIFGYAVATNIGVTLGIFLRKRM